MGQGSDTIVPELGHLRLIQAKQNAHQRTFARAVFAQQGVYLAFAQLQGDIIVCLDPREFLGCGNVFAFS